MTSGLPLAMATLFVRARMPHQAAEVADRPLVYLKKTPMNKIQRVVSSKPVTVQASLRAGKLAAVMLVGTRLADVSLIRT